MNHISYEQTKELVNLLRSDIQRLEVQITNLRTTIQNSGISIDDSLSENGKYEYFRVVFEHSARGEVVDKLTGSNIYGIAITELFFYNTDGEIISNAPYAVDWQADSVYNNRADFGVDKAFDNDPETEWGSNNAINPDHWLSIRCAEKQKLAKIGIMPRTKFETDGKPITISIQASNGSTWVTLKTFDNLWDGWEVKRVRFFEL